MIQRDLDVIRLPVWSQAWGLGMWAGPPVASQPAEGVVGAGCKEEVAVLHSPVHTQLAVWMWNVTSVGEKTELVQKLVLWSPSLMGLNSPEQGLVHHQNCIIWDHVVFI